MHCVTVVSLSVTDERGNTLMVLPKPERRPLGGGTGRREAIQILESQLGQGRTVFNGTKRLKLDFRMEPTASEPVEITRRPLIARCSQTQGCLVEEDQSRGVPYSGSGPTLEAAILSWLKTGCLRFPSPLQKPFLESDDEATRESRRSSWRLDLKEAVWDERPPALAASAHPTALSVQRSLQIGGRTANK